jgi:hypothetical protein
MAMSGTTARRRLLPLQFHLKELQVFHEMPLNDNTAGRTEQFVFQVPTPLESTTHEMLLDMSQSDAIWGDQIGYVVDWNGGLLDQLPQHTCCFVEKEVKSMIELHIYDLLLVSGGLLLMDIASNVFGDNSLENEIPEKSEHVRALYDGASKGEMDIDDSGLTLACTVSHGKVNGLGCCRVPSLASGRLHIEASTDVTPY